MTIPGTVLLLSLLLADEPRSQAAVQELPADGSWVTFLVNADVDNRELRLTMTSRSVGKTTVAGKPCRFLELEIHSEQPIEPVYGVLRLDNVIWRFVVPEEAFGPGKQPLSKALKIWRKQAQEDPAVVPSIVSRDPILDAILRGPTANILVATEKENITWQRGKLACQVVTGHNDADLLGGKLRFQHRVLRSSEVPFGVAGVKQTITAAFDGIEYKADVQLILSDYGTGAKPKLPQLVP